MKQEGFAFDIGQFNRLFPFFLLLNEQMRIEQQGESLIKLHHDCRGEAFGDCFTLKRPDIDGQELSAANCPLDQLVILETRTDRIMLRGQFELLSPGGRLLFIGSPWFGSVDQVKQNGLTLRDFALHDPLIDLLHLLKAQEIATEELKQLLYTINQQKKDLQAANRLVEDIARFPTQNPDPLYRIDLDGGLLMMNPAGEQLAEFFFEQQRYDRRAFWKHIATRINRQEERISFEAWSGKRIYSFICRYLPEQAYYNIYGRDVTEQKNNEEELKRLSLVASMNKNGVLFMTFDGAIFWCNEGFRALTGFDSNDIEGQPVTDLCKGPLTDRNALRQMVERFLNKEAFDIELLFYRKDGSQFWGRVTGQPIPDPGGEPLQYFAMIEDVTERKATEERLRHSELRWKFALEGAGEGVWEYNLLSGAVYFSAQYKRMLDFQDEEFHEDVEGILSRIHPEDLPMIMGIYEDYTDGHRERHECELRIRNRQGDYIWVHERGMLLDRTPTGLPHRLIGTQSDITERKLAEQTLQIREEKYRNIITNMNLGLVEVDTEDRIQFANLRFCEMSGYELHELIGRHASGLFTNTEQAKVIRSKNELRQKGVSDAYEIAVRTKSNETRWWLVSGAPRYTDAGALIGSIGIHLDITEQKVLEQKLNEARVEAEQSARAKEQFLANMSHEIRTPMNAILGMGRQLEKTSLTGRQQLFLNTINTAAEHLLVIINDILDISKIDAGKLDVEQIGFAIQDVLTHATDVIRHRADEKGLLVQTDFDPSAGPVLIGDPYRLNQVLLNLLSNAVKFTERGEVRIRCRVDERTSGQQRISIIVEDTGIGMDEAYLSSLFEKFSQEDRTTARKYGGTGLGMAISRQLVELMQGEIEVASRKGEGTRVRFTIPFRLGSSKDLPHVDEQKTDSDLLRGKSVLLAEDNEMNRLVARTVLEPYDLLLTEAENGREAVRLLQQAHFDLVLMDLHMPVMSGIEATEYIRRELGLTTPIIALTANAIKGESEHCFRAGMNGFVSKPFAEQDLIQAMLACVSGSSGISKAELHTREEKEEPAALYRLDQLQAISRDNSELLHALIGVFLQETPEIIHDIRQAFAQDNLDQVAALAHKVKPSIDNLQITSIQGTVRELEALAKTKSDRQLTGEKIRHIASVIDEVSISLRRQLPALH